MSFAPSLAARPSGGVKRPYHGPVRGLRPRLVTIGDLTLDVIVQPAGEAESGTEVPATIRFRAGGSAANTARAFARLSGAATFIGAVGSDRVGRLAAAALREDR